jgi:UDP-2,3-diacylglucosamine hydrolase
MLMRSVFIADAHLQTEGDASYQALLAFLGELRGTTATLYIMGDFFEFWLGYPGEPFPHYRPVLAALQELVAGGTELVYFEGNHDFHLGSFFTETLRARVFTGAASLEMAGRPAYLCHGDQISPELPTRILRALFHSRLTRWLTSIIPPSAATVIADILGRKGRMRLHAKGTDPAVRERLRAFAAQCCAHGHRLVIAGHFHDHFSEPVKGYPGCDLVSLGDWATRLSYAELRDDGTIALLTYRHPAP